TSSTLSLASLSSTCCATSIPSNKGVSTLEKPFPTLLMLANTFCIRSGEEYFIVLQPTPPPSPIAQPPSPQQQSQPSQDAAISMDLLHNLLDTCTTLTRRVENLKHDKIAQALEISKLKQRVKKLERRHKLKGRIIADMDADADVTLKDIAKDVVVDAEMKESADGVVIRDPEETSTPTPSTIIHSEAKSKDKGKRIFVEEPKPLKKQAQIEQDKAYARELEAELNKNIDWDEVIDHVQRKEKEDNVVNRYQALKRKPQTEAQARKNMMIYLRNKKFNSNVAFLHKTKEQMEEEYIRALKRISETQEEKAAKKQKLVEEISELKRHIQIMPNDDDNVYTEATPVARKVPVVDYEIYTENNKPYYKI
nr:hypothetical protein [Tanacetum cinerariifolium]